MWCRPCGKKAMWQARHVARRPCGKKANNDAEILKYWVLTSRSHAEAGVPKSSSLSFWLFIRRTKWRNGKEGFFFIIAINFVSDSDSCSSGICNHRHGRLCSQFQFWLFFSEIGCPHRLHGETSAKWGTWGLSHPNPSLRPRQVCLLSISASKSF